MGRKPKIKKPDPDKSYMDSCREESATFDLDAILFLADIWYNVRSMIQEESKKYHRDLGPITKEACIAAAESLGLKDFVAPAYFDEEKKKK